MKAAPLGIWAGETTKKTCQPPYPAELRAHFLPFSLIAWGSNQNLDPKKLLGKSSETLENRATKQPAKLAVRSSPHIIIDHSTIFSDMFRCKLLDTRVKRPIPPLGFDDFTTPHTIYSLSPITATLCITIDVYIHIYIYTCRKVKNPTKLYKLVIHL